MLQVSVGLVWCTPLRSDKRTLQPFHTYRPFLHGVSGVLGQRVAHASPLRSPVLRPYGYLVSQVVGRVPNPPLLGRFHHPHLLLRQPIQGVDLPVYLPVGGRDLALQLLLGLRQARRGQLHVQG